MPEHEAVTKEESSNLPGDHKLPDHFSAHQHGHDHRQDPGQPQPAVAEKQSNRDRCPDCEHCPRSRKGVTACLAVRSPPHAQSHRNTGQDQAKTQEQDLGPRQAEQVNQQDAARAGTGRRFVGRELVGPDQDQPPEDRVLRRNLPLDLPGGARGDLVFLAMGIEKARIADFEQDQLLDGFVGRIDQFHGDHADFIGADHDRAIERLQPGIRRVAGSEVNVRFEARQDQAAGQDQAEQHTHRKDQGAEQSHGFHPFSLQVIMDKHNRCRTERILDQTIKSY